MYKRKRVFIVIVVSIIAIGLVVLLNTISNTGSNKLIGTKDQRDIKKINIDESKAKVENTKTKDNGQTRKNETKEYSHLSLNKVKAVYYSGAFASSEERINHIIDIIRSTELNSIVIDVKEAGRVNYESQVPEVKDNKLYIKYYNPKKLIKKLHENNIYVIARIVCFRDDGLASKRVDLAIKTPKGAMWRENKNDPDSKWTSPYNQDVWKYNIDIAKEAADNGFDEIQFDYVRFPAAGSKEILYGENMPSKADAIAGFLKMASKELREGKGVPVSADIFGIACISPLDGNSIGQVLERVGMDVDYICPMVYPSHYANSGHGAMGNGVGQKINGISFTAPDLKPYDVVYNTLIEAKNRILKVQNYRASVRPYLQDFTASYIRNKNYYQEYDVEQVRQQIKAVYDAGYEQWILWNGQNSYTESALLKE